MSIAAKTGPLVAHETTTCAHCCPTLAHRGPFSSHDHALADIEAIKARDEFKGLTLTPIRIDIFVERPSTPPKETPPLASNKPLAEK
jgi:hypothetical protein